jgi:hypothetical protein
VVYAAQPLFAGSVEGMKTLFAGYVVLVKEGMKTFFAGYAE